MTKTSVGLLMPAKRCFPQNVSIQTAKKLCFALCGPSSASLITLVQRKSLSRLVTSQSPSSTVNGSEMACVGQNVCEGMPTAYVDGCSYNHKGNLKAGAGVVWLNKDTYPTQQLKLGPHSSQYA